MEVAKSLKSSVNAPLIPRDAAPPLALQVLYVPESTPFYSHYIRSHQHALEDIFFVTGSGNFSDSLNVLAVIAMVKRRVENIRTTILENITMTHNEDIVGWEERNFERMRMMAMDNIITPSTDLRHCYLMALSEIDASHLCLNDINNAVCVSDRENRVVRYEPNVTRLPYDPTYAYGLLLMSSTRIPSISRLLFDASCLVYKYQDPVVRMVCEYMILLNDEFVDPEVHRLRDEKVDRYYRYLVEESQMTEEEKEERGEFTSWIKVVFAGRQPKTALQHRLATDAPREGGHCLFGRGYVNCCSDTLRRINLPRMYLNLPKFTTTAYDEFVRTRSYREYQPPPPDLFERPGRFCQNDQDAKFADICQRTIDIIIACSGRSEGTLPAGMLPMRYPPISLLEVFDPENMVWIVRSERFHLSRSPCVHFGLHGYDITDRLISMYDLPRDNYQSNVVLHSIAHALDRLYCGHEHRNVEKYAAPNQVVFDQILNLFDAFVRRIQAQPSPIGKSPSRFLIRPNLNPELLFCISTNQLPEYLRSHPGTRMSDVFDLPAVKKELGVERDLTPQDLRRFLDMHFRFFDVKYSYDKELRMTEECREIKKIYGCRDLSHRPRYL